MLNRRYICPITKWEFTADDDRTYLKFCDEYTPNDCRRFIFLSYIEFYNSTYNGLGSYLTTDPLSNRLFNNETQRLVVVKGKDNKEYVWFMKFSDPWTKSNSFYALIGEYIIIDRWKDLLKDFMNNVSVEELTKYIR